MQTKRSYLSVMAVAFFAPWLWVSAQTTSRPTITPSLTHVDPGQSHQFKIEIDGKAATGVSWTVNDVKGGNATFGTISSSRVYTAPPKMPSPREIHIHAIIARPRKFHVWATVIVGP